MSVGVETVPVEMVSDKAVSVALIRDSRDCEAPATMLADAWDKIESTPETVFVAKMV